MDPSFIIGIDLGTTNSVVSYVRADAPEGAPPDIRVFEVPQLMAPAVVENRQLLPSALLLPGPNDVAASALALPWRPMPPTPWGRSPAPAARNFPTG